VRRLGGVGEHAVTRIKKITRNHVFPEKLKKVERLGFELLTITAANPTVEENSIQKDLV
jgi:hypothetical protein